MPAILEIFNPDGSLRFSSERFKVLKYDGEYTPLLEMDIRTGGDWNARWEVSLMLHTPKARGAKGLAFIPWLSMVRPQTQEDQRLAFVRVLSFPHNINRAQLWEHVRQPGFTVSM